VITETSARPGTSWLLDLFRRAGFAVIKTPDADGERGSALVSRIREARDLTTEFAAVSVPCRVSATVLDTEPTISVVGVYVPNRDRSAGKTERKQRFILHAQHLVVQRPLDREQVPTVLRAQPRERQPSLGLALRPAPLRVRLIILAERLRQDHAAIRERVLQRRQVTDPVLDLDLA
jgi:hypothetical protein